MTPNARARSPVPQDLAEVYRTTYRVRLLLFRTGAGFDFEVLVDRGFDVGRARGRRPAAGLVVAGRADRALVS